MIQRRTPLRRTGFPSRPPSSQRRAHLRRRSYIRRFGARAKREAREVAHFRRVVLARGRCERCGTDWRLIPHHMERRWKAKKNARHLPENGMCCCRDCHDLIHDAAVPDWRRWFK